jgi:hypothetical protein
MSRKGLVIAVLSALAAILALPAGALAATVFGSSFANAPNQPTCREQLGSACTMVSLNQPPSGGGEYTAGSPVSGVITHFELYVAAAAPAQVALRTARLSLIAGSEGKAAVATLIRSAVPVTVIPTPPGEAKIEEFATQLPITKGEHLAVDSTDVSLTYDSSGDRYTFNYSPTVVDGTHAESNRSDGVLQVQASVEPDADGDGFGDETQDQCPSQATTQGPCDYKKPQVTGVRVTSGVARYRVSEESTVQISLERGVSGHQAGGKCHTGAPTEKQRKCLIWLPVGTAFSAPGKAAVNKVALSRARKGKKLTPGSYRMTFEATDVAGNERSSKSTFAVEAPKRR